MLANRRTLFLTSILSTLFFFVLIIANYYQVATVALLANYGITFPGYVIPVVSIVLVGIIMTAFLLRRLENERLQYEFFTIVTHKFRTPLTGIRWAIEMLHNNITMQQKEDILRQIEKTNQRLMEIVDLLVNFVKFDKGLDYAYEATSLRGLVDVSLQKYAEQIRIKNIAFAIDPAQALPLLILDKNKMQFVVDMLIDNAIKYTPSGGTITISFKQEKGAITLYVHDTGIGITPSDMKRVFKPFFRSDDAKITDTEGMGLGLSTIKKIVDKHGGQIGVESPGKGKGSTFFVQFKVK